MFCTRLSSKNSDAASPSTRPTIPSRRYRDVRTTTSFPSRAPLRWAASTRLSGLKGQTSHPGTPMIDSLPTPAAGQRYPAAKPIAQYSDAGGDEQSPFVGDGKLLGDLGTQPVAPTWLPLAKCDSWRLTESGSKCGPVLPQYRLPVTLARWRMPFWCGDQVPPPHPPPERRSGWWCSNSPS